MSIFPPAASRRSVLGLISASAAAACAPGRAALAASSDSVLTPACGRRLTSADAEGPFFKPKSPERRDLAVGIAQGVRLSLAGRVLDPCGRPVAGALLDVWQADAAGDYDLKGYVLRGHQYTGLDGAYRLQTIAPRWYGGGTGGPPPFGPPPGFAPPPKQEGLAQRGPPPGGGLRTPHIHIKLQAPGGPLLTTQLFLPGDLKLYGRTLQPLNLQDGLYRPELRLAVDQTGNGDLVGRFDFVVATAVD